MTEILIVGENPTYQADGVNLVLNNTKLISGNFLITKFRVIFFTNEEKPDYSHSVKFNFDLIEIPHWSLHKIQICDNMLLRDADIEKKYSDCYIIVLKCANARRLTFFFKDVVNFDMNVLLTELFAHSAAALMVARRGNSLQQVSRAIFNFKSKLIHNCSTPKYDKPPISPSMVLTASQNDPFLLEDLIALLPFPNKKLYISSNEVLPHNPSHKVESIDFDRTEQIPLFSYYLKTSQKALFTNDTNMSDLDYILPCGCPSGETLIFGCDVVLPAISKLSKSFYKMCKLCYSESSMSMFRINRRIRNSMKIAKSVSDFQSGLENQVRTNTTRSFHSISQNTKWQQYVGQALSFASKVSSGLKKNNIILKSSDFPLALVISSLVKVMLDPFYRTIEGFLHLIIEEWISKRYRFNPNIDCLASYGYSYEPSIVFFFSALHNLSLEYYMEFEFDTNFLLILSDLLPSGIFHSYFVKEINGDRFIRGINPLEIIEFWSKFRNSLYYKNLSSEIDYSPQPLISNFCFCNLELWDEYFLRWTLGTANLLEEREFYKKLVLFLLETPVYLKPYL
ncbi:hypothetical protein HZS_5332 [Henneguya salminicola]|nr:hypothetical protein HZS_5332 [Henneguya salminicola]